MNFCATLETSLVGLRNLQTPSWGEVFEPPRNFPLRQYRGADRRLECVATCFCKAVVRPAYRAGAERRDSFLVSCFRNLPKLAETLGRVADGRCCRSVRSGVGTHRNG